MAKPRITLTTPYDSQGLQLTHAKNIAEIPTTSPETGAPNKGGRFSTNISLYLRNGARQGHSYYGKLIGTHVRSINLRVHISPGSAETLVMRGGITNHSLIAYSLSNISAKNYQNRLMCVEVILCNISVVIFETQCTCIQINHIAVNFSTF